MYGTNTVRRTYSVQHTIVHCTVRTTQAQTSVEIMDSKVTTCTLHGVYSVLYTYSMLHDDMYTQYKPDCVRRSGFFVLLKNELRTIMKAAQ